MSLIDPKKFEVTDLEGNERVFYLGKMPALVGQEVVAKFANGAMPKVGSYESIHESTLKIMRYVAIEINGELVTLKTEALINNHMPDTNTLAVVQLACVRRVVSFFPSAGSLQLKDFLLKLAQELMHKITPTQTN